MEIKKKELLKYISELKYAELRHLENGETSTSIVFEVIEMLEALETGELEVVDNDNA